jgi:RecJ-like exonuclease
MPKRIKCSTCHGDGRCYVNKKGFAHNFFKPEPKITRDTLSGEDYSKDIKKYSLKTDTCPSCHGAGKRTIFIKEKVMAGYPQWHKKTIFDSRFHDHNRSNCQVCELCSKTITSVFSKVVPVTGKGSNGVIHGMYVGQDCATKFFGIKNFKKNEIIAKVRKLKK